jgi:hypothetical protein
MSKLVGTGNQGDFVLNNQTVAKDEGFRNVSKLWFDKTQTFEQGREALAVDRANTKDINMKIGDVQFSNEGPDFKICLGDTCVVPNDHSAAQLAVKLGISTWQINSLMTPKLNHNKTKAVFERDEQDAETLVALFNNAVRRVKSDKSFLFRTRTDGTLRAFLSDRYAIVNNEWFMDTLEELIPGGRLSHSRGDSDTLYSNVLIPDTIREDEDSDYGGMLSVGNSEIGVRRISTTPSIFRAICMNGCIWDQNVGKSLNKRHTGKIDLGQLKMMMRKNLDEQIPLLPQGIDLLISSRDLKYNGAMKAMFAQVAKDMKIDKSQASGLLKSYAVEVRESELNKASLFGVVNSVTRTGQALSNQEWLQFDQFGGTLLSGGSDGWNRLTKKANGLSVEEVDEMFVAV